MIGGKGNGCTMSTCYMSGTPYQAVLYIVQRYWKGSRIYLPGQSCDTQSKGQPVFGNNLTQSQPEEFSDVISNTPGCTDLVEHHVLTRDVHPV